MVLWIVFLLLWANQLGNQVVGHLGRPHLGEMAGYRELVKTRERTISKSEIQVFHHEYD